GEPRGGAVALSLGASHAFAHWHLVGEHHLRDALLAAGAAIQCGLRFEEAIEGLGDLRLPPGRFELHTLPQGATAVYDAYNASPTSMKHALHTFASLPASRHIAVLGSMAELGSAARIGHESTGAEAARAGVDELYCGGDHAQTIAQGALAAGLAPTAVHTYVTNAEIAQTLNERLRNGDMVLLKGSRVQRMEEILNALLSARPSALPTANARAAPRGEISGESPLAAPSVAFAASEGAALGVGRPAVRTLPGHQGASFHVEGDGAPEGVVALPVRTPLIESGDDIARLVADSVRGIAGPDDVVCVSETAVAIAQGRSIRAEAIRPSLLARVLADQAGSYATMSQPESVQLVIENVGAAKVVAAAIAGAAGRLIGRRGDFYRMLGAAVAEIDGYTGTMPPFERHIVLGPEQPQAVAEAIARECGAHAAVVDANDLHKAEVLGASALVNVETVRLCLMGNPHGNGDQQTPVVVLKYRAAASGGAAGASPLHG
ncbi:MAG: coenzyme F420-0:L-glutamate ligase, partial [Candidatus Eremiobacteraeota bacterium]|nr:coenzyme F420-0:L-glutamate ligase [Candidatus Eremiobacteraeota bacterium]